MPKTGLLLINLGTPDAPTVKSVRCYLREFLSDPRVIDIPALLRAILLNFVILPFRPKQTAKAYQQIWGEHGSPLLHHSRNLQMAMQQALGEDVTVTLGMRYGNPNIPSAIEQLMQQGCQHIEILPLFPQYSSAANGSAIEKVLDTLKNYNCFPSIRLHNEFYSHPLFIQAYKTIIEEALRDKPLDFLLFSFHGLPQRHVDKAGCQFTGPCQVTTCPAVASNNLYCYRAQCFTTANLIAEALDLPPSQYQVAFQSRLGGAPWIKPYTDLVLPELANKGIKKLAVVCPSFVADCLETLEEVGIRANKQWQSLTGESLTLISCTNAHPNFVDALVHIIQQSPTMSSVT